MSKTSTTSSSGIGLGGLLGTAFIVLKLCHVIEWSWLWVLAPFWIPLAIVAAVLTLAGVMLVSVALYEKWGK